MVTLENHNKLTQQEFEEPVPLKISDAICIVNVKYLKLCALYCIIK